MIELNRYYENGFFPLETTEGNFTEGTDRHIALLEAHNPGGIYDAIILEIKARRDLMKNAISARDSEGTEQEGSTILMNTTITAFIKFARIREGLIKSTFEGDDTPQYEEFFPHGLTEYDQATVGTIETLMDRMVTKATKYETELGTTFKTDCIAKRTAFTKARADQLTNIGQAITLEQQAQHAIEKVAEQLSINLHTTALNNVGHPDRADWFFEQRFFQRPEQSGLYTGENAANQTKTVRSQGWSADKTIKVTNNGTFEFEVGFMNADGVPVTGGQTIAVGQTKTFTPAQLGYNATMHFLNITALAGNGAKWKVEIS